MECRIFWSDAYELEHEKIDKEHQKLFSLANDIYNCKEDLASIKIILKELIKYTKFHFSNEEIYMKSVSYSGIEEHKKLHKEIVMQLNSIVSKIDTLSIKEIKEKLGSFITDNIVAHILLEDKKVHHFRRNKDELRDMFKWKEGFKLGISLIDKEHQKLFLIAQKALSYSGQNKLSHVKNTIKELYAYMKQHFENEEKYMENIGYPLYEEHKMLHQNIINQMNDFIKKLPQMKIEEFERKLIEYMDIWLVNHIVYEDNKISQFKSTQI